MKTTTTATETVKLTPEAFLNSLQEVMKALTTIRSSTKKRTEADELPHHLARLTRWLAEFPAEECPAQNRLPLNGYSNLETWKAYEWLTGDDYQSRYWRVKAEEIWERLEDDGIDDRSQRDMAEYELADLMREELFPSFVPGSGFIRELVRNCFDEVDWLEIAGSFLDEIEC